MAKLCEKCGHYDATAQLTADSCCPACGLVYAKWSPSLAAPETMAGPTAAPAAVSSFPTIDWRVDWQPLNRAQVWLTLGAMAVLFTVILIDDDGFVLMLDHANLAFHEAGHLFFGLLGGAFGLYGGTLGQLVFPTVAILSFWRRGHAIAAASCGVWLFENYLNIARYMADARSQVLPLVGGGEHDWYLIFSRWGLLERDTAIASVTEALGWLGMIGCMLWLWRQFDSQQR